MFMKVDQELGVGNRPPRKKTLQIPGSVWFQVKLNHALFLIYQSIGWAKWLGILKLPQNTTPPPFF